MLRRASDIADDSTLGALFDRLRERSEGHLDRLQELLDRRHAKASWIKDATLRLGGLNWALFFQAQPDSASKLTAFAYAVVHLKIGGYAHLRGVAERAGDRETVAAVDAMLVDERQAAAGLKSQFSHAVAVSLKQPV